MDALGDWLRAELWPIAKGLAAQFASPGISVYWLYLTAAGVLAAAVFVLRERRVAGLLGFLLPRRIWLHRSTGQDLAIFVINTLLYSFWFLAPLQWISTSLGRHTWLALSELGSLEAPLTGTAAMACMSLAVFVVGDLAFFLAHYLMHRVGLLWEFHKVHHSAPVLQPLTVLRQHPVDVLLKGVISGVLLGPVYGLAAWLGDGGLSVLTIQGVNALLFVGLFAGFNLQHSHVWLSFGRGDDWVISPATHQLHHSVDPAHHDRNFGNLLAIWDRAAGTLLRPRSLAKAGTVPRLEFGLGARGGAWERDYGRIWRLYLWPFWRAGQRVRAALSRARSGPR